VLGIKLTHSAPGRPSGRGKIERYFRTVRDQFLVEIATGADGVGSRVDSLAELNSLFTAWVEQVYHQRVHSETRQAPLARFLAAGPPVPDLLRAQGVAWERPAPDAPVGSIVTAVTNLGHELTRAAAHDGNVVVSPLSVAYAFAMARAGAGGTTAAQLDQVLGFPASGLHEAMNAITRQVATTTGPPAPPPKQRTANKPPAAPVVALANGLFPDRTLPVGADFLRILAAQYDTGVYPVDFAGNRAADAINAWVDRQTAGQIPRLADCCDPQTRLVLASALYFRGDWPRVLEPDSGPFTPPGSARVVVPTLLDYGTLRYAAGDGWQAVEIPYAGGTYAMRLLLPPVGTDPVTLLAPAVMAAAAARLAPTTVEVILPRWNFATDLNLIPALSALGLTAPFDQRVADFAGIYPGLFINQANHKATISVDQYGTVAAAVTGLSFVLSAPPPPDVQVQVDHPFAFAIVHLPTGLPLFMGQVTDPRKTG